MKAFLKSLLGKFFLMSMIPIIGLSTLMYFAEDGIQSLSHNLDKAHQLLIPNIEAYNEILYFRISLGYYALQEITYGNSEPKKREGSHKKLIKAFEEFKLSYKKSLEAPTLPDEVAIMKNVHPKIVEFIKETETLITKVSKNTSESDKEATLDISSGKWQELAKDIRVNIELVTKLYSKTSKEENVFQKNLSNHLKNILLITFLLIVIANTSILIISGQKISKNLKEIAKNLEEGVEKVLSNSNETELSSSTLSASVTEQTAALQETSASVEETSAMINRNADNAKATLEVAAKSQIAANNGKDAITQMNSAIDGISSSNNEILDQIEESNTEMAEIVKLISEIGNKTKVINDIVFQTKLLSFNASVEAARAGEQGKGFAVVADEVGKLAEMSGNSAKEITDMLSNSIKKVEEIARSTKNKVDKLVVVGKEKVDVGIKTSQLCSNSLDEIVINVERVNELVKEISVASNEQAQGVIEITKAMGELDNSSSLNNQVSLSVSKGASDLKIEVQNMKQVIDKLNYTILGQ